MNAAPFPGDPVAAAIAGAVYTPPGPVTTAYLLDMSFVDVILGPVGSGKTTASIIKGVMCSQRQPKDSQGRRRSRGAVIRNTFSELKTTTIKSWFEWVPQEMGRWQAEGPPTHHVIGEDGLDMEVLFLALDRPDDVRKLLSLELTWAFINEGREVAKAVLDALTARVGRFPPMRDGGCNVPQIFIDSNPPDSDHWLYKLAEEDRPEGYRFYRQSGGRTPNAENIANLPEGYYARMVAGKDADWVKVYVDAEYGFVRDGRPVYPQYSDSIHCKPFELSPAYGLHVGLDFGLTPSATFGQRTPSGQWKTRHEIVTDDMGVDRFGSLVGQFLREKFGGWTVTITGDPAGSARDYEERTAFQILKKHGVHAKPASTNDWTPRRDAVESAHGRLVHGEPGYLLHPDCKVLRKAKQGGYCLRRLAVVGQERYRDAPDKNEYSHVAEAEQYMMLGGGEGRRIVGRDPVAIERRQKFAQSDYQMFSDQ